MKKYPLANSSWDDDEIEAIQQVVQTGMFTMGERVASFEKAFAAYVGSKYCVMVNSGSSANLLMVGSLFFRANAAIKAGDEVIVPAVSWSTTYYPLQQYGLKLKFVDIDKETLNYDLDALERAINSNTRLIMVVNLLGNPNEFNKIAELIADRPIVMIEDNCESMGAKYEGKQTGTFGLMGSFSAFFSHHISTMEGGMIVTDDEELYQILVSMRAHGWTRGLPKNNKVCGQLSDDPFFESFRFVLPGYNVRPLEMSGAIGLQQLKKLPSLVNARRKNAATFQNYFNNHPYITIQKEIGESSWFGFSLLIKENAPFDRHTLIKVLSENGIECRPIVAGNFTQNPVINWFDYSIFGELVNADKIHVNGLFVGNHHYDISEELNYLNDTVNKLNS